MLSYLHSLKMLAFFSVKKVIDPYSLWLNSMMTNGEFGFR